MKSFRSHLNSKLKDPEFKKLYEEEQKLAEIALKLCKLRKKLGLTQQKLAKKAKITQQQISKIENGFNFNFITFIKVCDALDLELKIIHNNK